MIQELLSKYEEKILRTIRDKKITAFNETHWYNRTRTIYGIDTLETKSYRDFVQRCESFLKDATTDLLFDMLDDCGYSTEYYSNKRDYIGLPPAQHYPSKKIILIKKDSRRILVILTTPFAYNSASLRQISDKINEVGADENIFVLLSHKTSERAHGYTALQQKYAPSAIIKWDFLQDFVVEFLGGTVWEELEKFFAKIVPTVKEIIGYSLVKICTDAELNKFKEDEKNVLCAFDYRTAYSKYSKNWINATTAAIATSMEKIRHQFFSEKTYEILLGNHDYAESFITAEWLYNQMANFQSLEKTPIAVGYLKSVEQLLYRAITLIAPDRPISLPNQSMRKTGDEISVTLGNIVNFIYSNTDIFSSDISGKLNDNIIRTLSDWRKNKRNGYLHRHNIIDENAISEIREMTIFIFYLILGSLKINEDILKKMR